VGSNSASAEFLVATENGTIDAYNSIIDPINAIIMIDNSSLGSVYKGLTIANNYLYATDFFNNRIDVFDFNFIPITTFPFIDQDMKEPLPIGYAPFNIVNIDNYLFVSYALQKGPTNIDDVPGRGNGYISVFKWNGIFVERLISQGKLNSPWGMIKAPRKFLDCENKFFVGNFGDGRINVYNFDGTHLGRLVDKNNKAIILDGLWGLVKNCDDIFFASGPDDEENGLVGKIKLRECDNESIKH